MTDERRAAAEFASRLQEVLGANLVSAVLYGSAARGDFRPGVSDINLLVIASDVGIETLRRVAPHVRAWIAAGNPPPMMLSEFEWQSSADVFPIEYTDIREAHIVLAGGDPFPGLRIDSEHLRLRLEHEMRSAKIQLREAYLAAGSSAEELGAVIALSVRPLLTLLRAALRLSGEPAAPRDHSAVAQAVAQRAGFDATSLLEVLRLRDSGEAFTAPIDGPLAAGYLHAVERATSWVDGIFIVVPEEESP